VTSWEVAPDNISVGLVEQTKKHSLCISPRKSLIYLHESIISELGAGQGGGGAEEAGVCHFLHGLSNGQDQGGVDEGHDDVRVKLICNRRQRWVRSTVGGSAHNVPN